MLNDMKVLTIENEHSRFKVLNYGLRILEFSVITEDNVRRNLVLEYDDLNTNTEDQFFMNSIIGPFAGRLADGTYTIDDEKYIFEQNENTNSLHSSNEALHDQYFDMRKEDNKIICTLQTLEIDYEIIYTLEGYSLLIEMMAQPKNSVYINMTQHTYFNLNGDSTIKDHYLEIPAKHFYTVDENSLPLDAEAVSNTLFDFRSSKLIGSVLSQNHEQFKITKNVDHTYVLDKPYVFLSEEKFGIGVKVETDASHCVIYLGNHLGDNPLRLSNGRILRDYAGIGIEPQSLPNDVNKTGGSIYDRLHPFRRVIKYTVTK